MRDNYCTWIVYAFLFFFSSKGMKFRSRLVFLHHQSLKHYLCFSTNQPSISLSFHRAVQSSIMVFKSSTRSFNLPTKYPVHDSTFQPFNQSSTESSNLPASHYKIQPLTHLLGFPITKPFNFATIHYVIQALNHTMAFRNPLIPLTIQ